MSDDYNDMLRAHEISELPNTINESEQYSVDSSHSISDFAALPLNSAMSLTMTDTNVSLEQTSEITDRSSSPTVLPEDYITFGLFRGLKDTAIVGRNVGPDAHNEVDYFNYPTS